MDHKRWWGSNRGQPVEGKLLSHYTGLRGTPSLSDQALLMSSIISGQLHSRPQDTDCSWAQPSSSRRQGSVSRERGGWIELIGKRVNSNCLMENVYSAISSCAINKSLTVLMILVEPQETARPDYTRPGSLLKLLHVLKFQALETSSVVNRVSLGERRMQVPKSTPSSSHVHIQSGPIPDHSFPEHVCIPLALSCK